MKLTESTLKMARISGLDYAESTDYMTNALRSFKMQMQDAEKIVNVYSAVAASSATNVEELAEAMSKTASSAEAVGSSFENTTAMMAVMIEATRQAPENIGSALKSIISRYGELKVNPSTLVDSQGEALSLNKVDTALQSVGIAIHNANGEFREFDDVIFELAQKWDTIDVNTQRYIATVMAGNRQQSRFLALVSSYERLKEEAEVAANSQNAAQLQYLKTLDSIEAKQQQLKTSMQSLYTSTGVQAFYGTLIDLGNSVIKTFTDMPTVFNLPIPALLKFGTTFYSLAKVVTTVFTIIKNDFVQQSAEITERLSQDAVMRENRLTDIAQQGAQTRQQIYQNEANARINAQNNTLGSVSNVNSNTALKTSMIASLAGLAGTALSIAPGVSKELQGVGAIIGGAGNYAAIGTRIGGMIGHPVAGAVVGAVTGALASLPEAIDKWTETAEQRVERLSQELTEASNKKLIADNELKTLTGYKKKWRELTQEIEKGNDVKEQQLALNAEIAANYPELIAGIDEQGNLILDLTKGYAELAQKKRQAAEAGGVQVGTAQLRQAQDFSSLLKQYGISYQTGSFEETYVSGGNVADQVNNSGEQLRELLRKRFGDNAFKEVINAAGNNIIQISQEALDYLNNINNQLEV